MAGETIERLRYFERQYLGVADFIAEQTYLRDHNRRHDLAQHTWGIVVGLDIVEQDKSGGEPGVDLYLSPGIVVDGFGREIVLLEPYPVDEELFAQYVYNPAAPDGVWIPLWIAYQEEFLLQPRYGYQQCDIGNQATRVHETFRLFTGFLTTTQLYDKVNVAGDLVNAADEVPDASVPYQSLEDTETARWIIPLGNVRWYARPAPSLPGNYFVKSSTPDDVKKERDGRLYAGNVSAAVLAPNGALRIADRFTDPTQPNYVGVAVEVEGSLQVDKLLVAKQDAQLHGGKLDFRNVAGADETIPLWMQRLKDATGTLTDLHIHLGDSAAPTTRFTVGPTDGTGEKAILAVKGDDTIDVPTGSVFFGTKLRQMLNLGANSIGEQPYGIGVQTTALYNRTQSDFRWYRGGQHKDDPNDAANGALQMRLDDQARLHLEGARRQMLNLFQDSSGTIGVGVQDARLYLRSNSGFAWYRHGDHSNTQDDPGSGGQKSMILDENGDLWVRGNIVAAGLSGPIITPPPGIGAIDVKVGRYPVNMTTAGSGVSTLTQTRTISVTSALTTTTHADIVAALSDIYNQQAATNARWRVDLVSSTQTGPNSWDFVFDVQVDDNDGYFYTIVWIAVFRGSY